MKILNNPTFIAGGNADHLPSQLNETTIIYTSKPIIGYTQTLIGWKLTDYQYDPIDVPNPSYKYACYMAIYDVKPI